MIGIGVFMDKKEVIDYICAIPVGTIIAWVIVVLLIINCMIAISMRFYKIFEFSQKYKKEKDTLKDKIDIHDKQLSRIMKQLCGIENILKDQNIMEFKRMRHEIVQAGEDAISKGSITIRQLKSLEELYEVYHDKQHGNGYVSTLMLKVRKLPIIGKLDKNDKDI